MERYEVTAEMIELHTGILHLDAHQGAARCHALADLGDGLYEIRRPVQFKRGEVFGYDGAVNKSLRRLVQATAAEVGAAPSAKPRKGAGRK